MRKTAVPAAAAEWRRGHTYNNQAFVYRGTSLIRNFNPPRTTKRGLGIGLPLGPRRKQFLMSEVPL